MFSNKHKTYLEGEGKKKNSLTFCFIKYFFFFSAFSYRILMTGEEKLYWCQYFLICLEISNKRISFKILSFFIHLLFLVIDRFCCFLQKKEEGTEITRLSVYHILLLLLLLFLLKSVCDNRYLDRITKSVCNVWKTWWWLKLSKSYVINSTWSFEMLIWWFFLFD